MLRIILFVLAFAAQLVHAEDRLIAIETRPGVKVAYWWMERPDAKATIVLLPGGEGGIGMKAGTPHSQNFLVRSRDFFADAGYNVAIVGKPSDKEALDPRFRAGDEHMADLRAVTEKLAKLGKPVWLVGTSLGSISAAAAASTRPPMPIAGIALTSSVTSTSTATPFSVLMLPLAEVHVPALVMHHKYDRCPVCEPGQAYRIVDALVNAPARKLLLVSGGGMPQGPACEALHNHGYIGMEKEAVDDVTAFIANPGS
jgi:alpha-beta hydrolase superfamily lysophospholipase